jgi:outer membrane protein assembly factor BamD (BamD/ComL family)
MRKNIAEQKLMVARFYERQRKFDSARIYYQIVAKQYTDTPFAEEANRWLEENPVKVSELQAQFEQGIKK